MTEKDQRIVNVLFEELKYLKSSMETLELSVQKCAVIIGKKTYSFEEQESFDSLTSKFSRASDIYTQKVLRSIWMLLHEPFVPFIDFLNKSEKMDLIESAEQLLEIRDLRNQIAHEYIPDAVIDLVPEVIRYCEFLVGNVSRTFDFLKKRNL